jgi:poly-gamma-glutamate capsule biosynthesis protein CapA/YwtB (metallophosphatase superfamily)
MNYDARDAAGAFAARLAAWHDVRGWKDDALAERDSGLRTRDLPAYGIKTLWPRRQAGVAPELLAHFAEANARGADALDQGAHWCLEPEGGRVTIAAIGDVMYCGHDADADLLDADLAALIRCNHDALLLNLETLTSPREATGRRVRGRFAFNAPAAMLDAFGQLGMPVVAALANNHVADLGTADVVATAREIEARGMQWAGFAAEKQPKASAGRYALVDVAGHAVAFVPTTWGVNPGPFRDDDEAQRAAGLASITRVRVQAADATEDLEQVRALIASARADGAELVIVAPHWGHEFECWPSSVRQMLVAREFAAAGADVVVGSHPHVLQPLEVLHVNMPERAQASSHVTDGTGMPRICVVAYSLGNFSTSLPGAHSRIGGVLSLELREATRIGHGGVRRLVPTGVRLNPTCAHTAALLPAVFPRGFRVCDALHVPRSASDRRVPDAEALRRTLARAEFAHLAPWLDTAPRGDHDVRWLRPCWAESALDRRGAA